MRNAQVLFFCLFIANVSFSNDVMVIGVTKDNKIISKKISSAQYAKSLIEIKSAMDEQVLKELQPFSEKGKWKLSKISLGLGLSGEIGIGPFTLGKSFKQRFIYTR